MKIRRSGILLSITSLPSPYGIGDLGPWAYKFVDFLFEAKQGFWQVLPLNPTDPAYDNSPYHSISALASNPLLISPELLAQDGLLTKTEIEPLPNLPREWIDYEAVITHKKRLFHLAYKHFKKSGNQYDYEKFCSKNAYWLEDFALFVALKSHFQGKVWSKWPSEIRDRQPEALLSLKRELQDRIELEKFLQYMFYKQWLSLKDYCHQKNIHIIGDMPIYVDYDSVDVWTNPEIFKLDSEKKAYGVAGVPPDYFSQTGQRWGNPVYKWEVLKKTGYTWWIQRMEHALKFFDIVRIDHFRGFVAYWQIPANEKTAIKGSWVKGPGEEIFKAMLKRFPCLPIIAEDLGVITPDVRELVSRFQFPGMKLLIFAFGPDLPTNPYIPHNYTQNCVVYTGTHDNNTIKGWFEKEITPEDKKRLFQYLGHQVSGEEIHWELIRLAMMSVANTVILPMQDVLGLGEEARMNRPATTSGNWRWRFLPEQLTPEVTRRLLEMTKTYGRDS